MQTNYIQKGGIETQETQRFRLDFYVLGRLLETNGVSKEP